MPTLADGMQQKLPELIVRLISEVSGSSGEHGTHVAGRLATKDGAVSLGIGKSAEHGVSRCFFVVIVWVAGATDTLEAMRCCADDGLQDGRERVSNGVIASRILG
jgi:hypothetical protein